MLFKQRGERPIPSTAKRAYVEILSLVFDFVEYCGPVLRKHKHDDRVETTITGTPRVFRGAYGSGDGAGV